MITLGIDIGGSGIKGALVDTEQGQMVTDRLRIPTPQPAKPLAVIGVLKQIVDHFEYSGPIGVGIPCIVINGVTLSAANIDDEWIGFASQDAMAEATGCPVVLGNDADVAGLAEMRFGAGRGQMGTVMIFTLGTGIGSAVFVNGRLVPNTELGHVYLRNQKKDAENQAAERIRDEKNLTWKQWGKRLNTYFQHMEFLFSPELFIIGGGISKQHAEFLPYIQTRARMVPAELRNEAGIVGAAVLAAETK
ncbi:MAG: ROK family protein [Anaerolineaceae bacterium]|nr:ROK family protein [Anaerolineaceae bacterium]